LLALLFFIDESGTDHKQAPYEVLGGVGILESEAWQLIRSLKRSQRRHFGIELDDVIDEVKGTHLLKRKVFKNAALEELIPEHTRRVLARDFLQKGQRARRTGVQEPMTRLELIAYSQSCIQYIRQMYEMCERHKVKTFAMLIEVDAPEPAPSEHLRKDMSSLFKLFYYAVDQSLDHNHGLLIFDERENVASRKLIRRISDYFEKTENGRSMCSKILPEPLFVHSNLTTLVQVADVVCYSVNWGYRLWKMDKPVRVEMRQFGELAAKLKYKDPESKTLVEIGQPAYGFSYFDDLRPAHEREKKTKAMR